MGGSHNVALAVLTEESNKFKASRQSSTSSRNSAGLFSYLSTSRVQSEAQYERNLLSTQKFVAFIACLAFSVYFFVTFKTYHAHLTKQDQLNTLLKNPNARVASGKKGKQVVKKLMAKNEEIKAIAKVEDDSADEESLATLIKAAKAKKAQKIVEEKSELLLSGY